MLDPIIKTVEVPCDKEKAFTVFLNEMGSWWPARPFTTSAMAGSTLKEIRVEPVVGGQITEVSEDGTEYLWGEILTYNPFDAFTMDFHIPSPDWDIGPMSHVEVRFTEMAENKTRVVLTHGNWEALGDMAPQIRGGYEHGWKSIFDECYAQACGD